MLCKRVWIINTDAGHVLTKEIMKNSSASVSHQLKKTSFTNFYLK